MLTFNACMLGIESCHQTWQARGQCWPRRLGPLTQSFSHQWRQIWFCCPYASGGCRPYPVFVDYVVLLWQLRLTAPSKSRFVVLIASLRSITPAGAAKFQKARASPQAETRASCSPRLELGFEKTVYENFATMQRVATSSSPYNLLPVQPVPRLVTLQLQKVHPINMMAF